MLKYAALLRAVNVVGRNLVKMAELRARCDSVGIRNPQTYLQSGNLIFASKQTDPSRLVKRLEALIKKEFGFAGRVVIRNSTELAKIIKNNPMPSREQDPSRLAVMFLATRPAPDAFAGLRAALAGPEEFHLIGEELYLYYPNGMGQSKLTNTVLEKKLGTHGTVRNWNTVRKLYEMAENLGK